MQRRIPLGAKVALTVTLALAAIAGALFFRLADRERDSLVEAKRAAAEMVVSLTAKSLSASIDFGDADDIRRQLDHLRSNPDVAGASVWLNGEKAPLVEVSDLTSVRAAERLEVSKEIVGRQGTSLATVRITFTLGPENRAYLQHRTQLFWFLVGLTLASAALIFVIIQRQMIGPLSRLGRAASELEKGHRVDLTMRRNDEIGDLARAFDSMSAAVVERQARLQQELALAARIQTSILPKRLGVPGLEIAACMVSASAGYR